MTPEAIILFVAKSITSHLVVDTWKSKVFPFLSHKATYVTQLVKVITKTMKEYEMQFPDKETRGKVKFYHSQILFESLSSFILFKKGSFDNIENDFLKNQNIIIPSKNELDIFFELFLDNVNKDKILKNLFIDENYKEEVFNNTKQIIGLNEKLSSVEINTRLIINKLNYNNNENYIIPKELTSLVPKLEQNKIVGRKSDLEDLRKRLFENKHVVLMNGMGGIGKTTLASVYLTEHYELYNHIAWITSSNNGFIYDLISSPGILESLNLEFIESFEKTFSFVKLKLNILNKTNLLIIDDATEDLVQYYDYLPNQHNWHIIVTSREVIENFDIMEVGFLNEEDAIKLFKLYYTREDLDVDYISELISSIELHTLTIEILSKTAQELRISPTELNNSIKNNIDTRIYTRHNNNKIGKILSYLTSIFDVSNLSDDAISILKCFILLPNDYIKNQTLDELLTFISDKLPIGRAELLRKGWILYYELEDSYKLHQIIFDVIKAKFPNNIEYLQPLVDSLTSIIKEIDKKPISNFTWIPFGKILLEVSMKHQEIEIENLKHNFVTLLMEFGEYEEAKKLLIELLNSNNSVGIDYHINTMFINLKLAKVHFALGDYNIAKKLLEKLKIECEKKIGVKHFFTQVVYSDLALVYKLQGNFLEAKKLFEIVIEILEKSDNINLPKLATSYSNLATVHQDIEEFNEAKVLLLKANEIIENSYGTNNPKTAISYSNLAIIHGELGEYLEMKVLLEKAVIISEKNFGESHLTTATNYSNLGMVNKIFENYENAIVLLEKALIIFLKKLGAEHPNTAEIYSNLATILRDSSDLKKAEEHFKISLILNEFIFGFNHSNTARNYYNLGVTLKDLGFFNEAKLYLEKAKMSYENILDTNHLNTATNNYNLGLTLKELGLLNEAKLYLEKAKISNENIFGTNHPQTAMCYSNLATFYLDLGEFDQAKKLFKKAVVIAENNYGNNHFTTAINYFNLGKAHIKFGEDSEALILLEKALEIFSKILGTEHQRTKMTKEIIINLKMQ